MAFGHAFSLPHRASVPIAPPPVSHTYATFNPSVLGGNLALSNGNLTLTKTGNGWASSALTIGLAAASGKHICELTMSGAITMPGVSQGDEINTGGFTGASGGAVGYYSGDGNKYQGGSPSAYGAPFTSIIIGMYIDMDAGTPTVEFFKDNGNGTGTSQGVITLTGLNFTSLLYVIPGLYSNGATCTLNAGASAFAFMSTAKPAARQGIYT